MIVVKTPVSQSGLNLFFTSDIVRPLVSQLERQGAEPASGFF
jgi:hypothetical protein